MGVWNYRESRSGISAGYFVRMDRRDKCPFCTTQLQDGEQFVSPYKVGWANELAWCDACGWWNLRASFLEPVGDAYEPHFYRVVYAQGSFREFALVDVDTPLNEVREFLAGKRDPASSISPRDVEKLVASVFRHQGLAVTLAARSGDEGIDIYLQTDCESPQVAVQVKRHRRRVDVSQVRAFLGALPPKGIRDAIFVSTSGFTAGARAFVEQIHEAGIARIDLRDSRWLLGAIGVDEREPYQGIEDATAPYAEFVRDPDLIRWGHNGYTIL